MRTQSPATSSHHVPFTPNFQITLKDILLFPNLLMVSGAAYFLFVPLDESGKSLGGIGAASNSTYYVLAWALCYAAAGAASVLLAKSVVTKLVAVPLVPLLVLWLILPTSMSYDPGGNLVKLLYFTMTVLTGAVMASAYTRDEFVKRLIVVAEIAVVLTIIGYLSGSPKAFQFAVENGVQYARSFRGFFAHKTNMGYFCFVSLSIFIFLYPPDWPRWRRYIFGTMLLVFLLMSNDITSIISCALIIGTYIVVSATKRDALPTLAFGLFGLLAVTFSFIFFLPEIFRLFGRSSSLTGRVDIWQYWWMFAQDHLIFGYGYAGFFGQSAEAPGQALWRFFQYYEAPAFHNTFLDNAIQGGLLAFVITAYLLFSLWGFYLVRGLKTGNPFDKWAAGFMTAYFTVCMVGTLILTYNQFLTVLFFYFAFECSKWRGRKVHGGAGQQGDFPFQPSSGAGSA